MSKGIKKVGKVVLHTLSGIILCAFLLALVIALAFSMPRVQTFAATSAVEWASQWLDTPISLRSISIEGLRNVVVKDLYVEDYYGDTLIYASKLSAAVNRAALLYKGKVQISNVVAEKSYLRLYKPDDGDDNLKQLTSRLEEKFKKDKYKSKSPFVLNKIRVIDSRFDYVSDKKQKKYDHGIDYADMSFSRLNASSDRLTVEGKKVSMDVYGISAVEKSGCVIDKMSAQQFVVDEGLLDFEGLYLASDSSSLDIPHLRLEAPTWKDYSHFVDNVRMVVESHDSTVDSHTLYWSADMPDYGFVLDDFSAVYDGTVNDFTAWIASAAIGDTSFRADAHVTSLTDFASVDFDFKSFALSTTPQQAERLYAAFTDKRFPVNIATYLDRLHSLAAEGSVSGNLKNIAAQVKLSTDIGEIDIDGTMKPVEGAETVRFAGTVAATDLNAGQLADYADLGNVTLTAEATVDLGKDFFDAGGQVVFDNVFWHGYDYRNISIEGTYINDIVRAAVHSTDENLPFTLEGQCDLSWLEPQYNFIFNLEGADLQTLGFSSGRTSWLSCNLEAAGEGSSLDNLVGRAMVNDFVYVSATDTLSTELVNIVANNSDEGKNISLYSSIADIEYRSRASYRDVIDYLKGDFIRQFPLMGGVSGEVGDNISSSDYSSVTVNIKSGQNLISAFVDDLAISSESSFGFNFSPSSKRYSLLLDCGYVEWRNYLLSQLRIESDNSDGKVGLSADVSEALVLGTSIPDVTLQLSAVGNDVDAAMMFSDSSAALSGKIAVTGTLGYDSEGRVFADASLRESYFMNGKDVWNISASKIYYDTQDVVVDAFAAQCGAQRIYVDGEISAGKLRPLKLELSDVKLGGFVELLTGRGGITGVANGGATLMSVMSNPFGNGEIDLSELSVGGIAVEPLRFTASIVPDKNDISITVLNSQRSTTLAEILYNTSSKNYRADLTAEDMSLSLLDPLLEGVVSGTSGNAAVDLHIAGEGSDMAVDGKVSVNDMHTKLAYTGVEYSFAPINLTISDNVGILSPLRINDKNNRSAMLDGSINISDFNNIGYGARLIPDNLMVLDLPAETDEKFYGTVYASGAVSVIGNSHGANVDAVLSTGNNSLFCLPLNGNTDFSSADFVKFVSGAEEERPDTTDIVVRKKLQLQRKNAKLATPFDVNLDAMLSVGTNTQLKLIIDAATDNVLVARGTADLNVTYNTRKDDLAIRGDYRISEGVYNFNFQNIVSKQFTINSGSYLRWNGSSLDADIDVSATYKLKTSLAPLLGNDKNTARSSTPVECIINLTNRLSAIDLSFDINVPTANPEYQSILSSYFSSQEMMATQFVYLLALGSFYSDSDSSTQGVGVGTTAGTAIGFDFLAGQVSKLVSNDDYKFNLKYKMIDQASSSYGVDFQTELVNDRLLLELEANVDTGEYQSTTDANQFSGGGSITLLLDDNGNFILKGFSRTIDRFDENQGLQENGVGLYFRRSFDRFGDLFRKKADKSKKDKRKK